MPLQVLILYEFVFLQLPNIPFIDLRFIERGRGRILLKQEVQAIQIDPASLFFIADPTRQLTLYKLAGEPIVVAS